MAGWRALRNVVDVTQCDPPRPFRLFISESVGLTADRGNCERKRRTTGGHRVTRLFSRAIVVIATRSTSRSASVELNNERRERSGLAVQGECWLSINRRRLDLYARPAVILGTFSISLIPLILETLVGACTKRPAPGGAGSLSTVDVKNLPGPQTPRYPGRVPRPQRRTHLPSDHWMEGRQRLMRFCGASAS